MIAPWPLLLVFLAQQTPPIEPPPVDEARLAARLVDMVKPQKGERAIIVYDPAYYPGITNRLRNELHRRGVQTYAISEDTAEMIAIDEPEEPAPTHREQDVVAALLPLFQASQIFYWMPERAYVGDLRWERLVEASKVRGVHFHWMLPYPGNRTNQEILEQTKTLEKRIFEVDLAEHAQRQERLARAIRGSTLHVTSPGGTDLRVRVPKDQWIHFGNGDASAERAAKARSIRDRQIELPVGMFGFIPEPQGFEGRIASSDIERAGGVHQAQFAFRDGRISAVEPAAAWPAIEKAAKAIGPDGDKIGVMWLPTNPFTDQRGVQFDVGSNWENGATNRATRMRRMLLRIPNADVRAGDRLIMRGGEWLWDAMP